MRKPELAAAIAERADLSKDKASQVLNVILDEITGSVSSGPAAEDSRQQDSRLQARQGAQGRSRPLR